jgi:hypothetical protein
MKARLIALYFDPGRDEEFDQQLVALRTLLADEAEILLELPLGAPMPEADAVVFPQLLGEAYRQLAHFKALKLPILIITSEFATVSMWDWEIASYLRSEGVETIAPYNLEQAKIICRALALKRQLRQSKLLVFQDNPGEGFQASIFKRFYWWEDECSLRMLEGYGMQVVKKSYQTLGAKAKTIPDREAEAELARRKLRSEGVSERALHSAVKLYLAVKHEIEAEGNVLAVGINCLNESHFSDTTPCLAWNWLFEEREMIWGCEGDTVTMLTKSILYKSIRAPLMMSNLYPFLMGQAALKHEHIPEFPEVPDPENHILVAHCGYLGVLPQSFATQWALKPKVLAIVDELATAIDARLPEGKLTLAKLGPSLDKLSVTEATLEGYVQYPNSHCLNGAVIRVPDGRRMLSTLESHHYLLLSGHLRAEIELVAAVFGWQVQII